MSESKPQPPELVPIHTESDVAQNLQLFKEVTVTNIGEPEHQAAVSPWTSPQEPLQNTVNYNLSSSHR